MSAVMFLNINKDYNMSKFHLGAKSKIWQQQRGGKTHLQQVLYNNTPFCLQTPLGKVRSRQTAPSKTHLKQVTMSFPINFNFNYYTFFGALEQIIQESLPANVQLTNFVESTEDAEYDRLYDRSGDSSSHLRRSDAEEEEDQEEEPKGTKLKKAAESGKKAEEEEESVPELILDLRITEHTKFFEYNKGKFIEISGFELQPNDSQIVAKIETRGVYHDFYENEEDIPDTVYANCKWTAKEILKWR